LEPALIHFGKLAGFHATTVAPRGVVHQRISPRIAPRFDSPTLSRRHIERAFETTNMHRGVAVWNSVSPAQVQLDFLRGEQVGRFMRAG